MAKKVVYGSCIVVFILLVVHLLQTVYLKNGLYYLSHSLYQPNFQKDKVDYQNAVNNEGIAQIEGNPNLLPGVEFVNIKNKPMDDTKWLRYPSVSERTKLSKTSTKICPPDKMTDWKFNCKIICPTVKISAKEHMQLKLNCQNATLYATKINRKRNLCVHTVKNVTCLQKVIKNECADEKIVPKVVHYIWFSKKRDFKLFNFISVLAASKFLKPCLIIIHGDNTPRGFYWDSLLKIVSNILFIFRNQQMKIFGKKLTRVEHRADVARIQILQEFGGIYTDTDEVILRSLDPLRNFPMTLSRAISNNLSNGLILAAKNATFLQLWLNKYKHYKASEWGYTSTIVPHLLSKLHPDLIHVEHKTFVKPNYEHLDQIFKTNFDWSKNYAIHLYSRFYKKKHNFTDIKYLNTTIGSVARHVIYGTKNLCF